MESNRRKNFEDYQLKISVFEQFLETINESIVVTSGEQVYNCPREELEGLGYWEKQEHVLKDDEELTVSTLPYPEAGDDDWKQRQNRRYELNKEAFKVVRQALEKWLDK